MRLLFILLVTSFSSIFLNAQEISENAKKFLLALQKEPSGGVVFDRFYDAWAESSSTKKLEDFLNKNYTNSSTAENILLLTFYYQKEGQLSKALEILNGITNKELLTSQVLYNKAKLETRFLNYATAIKNIDAALSLSPKQDLQIKLLSLKIQTQYQNGDPVGAKETINVITNINQFDPTIFYDILEFQITEDQSQDAKELYAKLIEQTKEKQQKEIYQLKLANLHTALKEFDEAEEIYSILMSSSEETNWLSYEAANQFDKRYGKRIVPLSILYNTLAKANPKNTFLHERYSQVLFENNDKTVAIEKTKDLIKQLPEATSVKENYISLLISDHKTEEAIQNLEDLISSQLKNKKYGLILNLIELHLENKNFPEAKKWQQEYRKKENITEQEILQINHLMFQYGQGTKPVETTKKPTPKKTDKINEQQNALSDSIDNQNYNRTRSILWSLIKNTTDLKEKISYLDKLLICYQYDLGENVLIENLKERYTINPQEAFPLLALFRIHQQLNNVESQNRYVLELLQAKIKDVKIYLQLATLLQETSNAASIEAVLKKAIEIDRTDSARNQLILFYINTSKPELALTESLRVNQRSFTEKDFVSIVENALFVANNHKAYHFVKNNYPIDKSIIYDYLLALTTRKVNTEEAEPLFYKLLEIKDKATFAQVEPEQTLYLTMRPYLPDLFTKMLDYGFATIHYANDTISQTNNKDTPFTPIKRPLSLPSNLEELHFLSLANLGDIYNNTTDIKKTEILNELKKRNIIYPEFYLFYSQKDWHLKTTSILQELVQKNPEEITLKLIHLKSTTKFNEQSSEEFLALLNDTKTKDKKAAFLLLYFDEKFIEEVPQEIFAVLEEIIQQLNIPNEVKPRLYTYFLHKIHRSTKASSENVLKKYLATLVAFTEDQIKKPSFQLYIQEVMPLLIKLNEPEIYAKIINQILSEKEIQTLSKKTKDLYHPDNVFDVKLIFPFTLNTQFKSTFYQELFATSSRKDHITTNDEFRKKVVPHIENKYCKAALYYVLQDTVELEKILKRFENSPLVNDLLILASYYEMKNQQKEAFISFQKALIYAKKIDDQKLINSKIVFYASIIDDPAIKKAGIEAAKRLKALFLTKEELIKLSIYLGSLDAAAEAQELDRLTKKTTKTKITPARSLTDITNNFAKLTNENRVSEAFDYYLSALTPYFKEYLERVKNKRHYNLSFYEFQSIIDIFKEKKLTTEFKTYVAKKKTWEPNELDTVFFTFYKFDEITVATTVAEQLIAANPDELLYKILHYTLKISSTDELNAGLKEAIQKDPIKTLHVVAHMSGGTSIIKANTYALKKLVFHAIQHLPNEITDTQTYFIIFTPFIFGTQLDNLVYASSILSTRENIYSKDLKNKKELDQYFQYFEELMLLCMQNKSLAPSAASYLFYYDIINQKPITDKLLQAFIEIFIKSSENPISTFASNFRLDSQSAPPIDVLLAIYYLNQGKSTELKALYEKVNDQSKAIYQNFLEKISLFYTEKPITLQDLKDLQNILESNKKSTTSSINFLMDLLKIIEPKNPQAQELLFSLLKQELIRQPVNDNTKFGICYQYLSNQARVLNAEEMVNFLLHLEKSILPKPFLKSDYDNSKKDWTHYTQFVSSIFYNRNFDERVVKSLFRAGLKSDFYFYIARRQTEGLRQICNGPIDNVLSFVEFFGNLSELQPIKSNTNGFFLTSLIHNFKRNQEMLKKLKEMKQTDGTLLLQYWLEDKNYLKVFEFFGSKLVEFKALPPLQQAEWIEFLSSFYKKEILQEQTMSDSALAFKNLILNSSSSNVEDQKKAFLEKPLSDDITHYQFLDQLMVVYPTILAEPEDTFRETFQIVQKKYQYYIQNWQHQSEQVYAEDYLIYRLLSYNSYEKNHLKILTELLSQKSNWTVDYYALYSRRVDHYINRELNNVHKSSEKDSTQLVISKINAILDEVVSINQNRVPIFVTPNSDFIAMFYEFRDTGNLRKLLLDDWASQKDLSTFKKNLIPILNYRTIQNDNTYENHITSMIEDPQTLPQIKYLWINRLMASGIQNVNNQKKVLPHHLKLLMIENKDKVNSAYNFWKLIENYQYDVLTALPTETEIFFKNWYRGFEELLVKDTTNNWRLYTQYSLKAGQIDAKIIQKLIKLITHYLEKEKLLNFFKISALNLDLDFYTYVALLKEGFEKTVLDMINENIEAIYIDLETAKKIYLTAEDLSLVNRFIEQINDPEKKNFAKALFYRIGIKTESGKNELDSFALAVNELLKQPIKDKKIINPLYKLSNNTELIANKKILQLIHDQNEVFDEEKLKTYPYKSISTSFRFYCVKFTKILQDQGLDQFKNEYAKTLENIKKSNFLTKYTRIIADALAEDLFLDPHIYKNANLYFEAISHAFETSTYDSSEAGKIAFNRALCLLALSHKTDAYETFIKQISSKGASTWQRSLSTIVAIKLFEEAYIQAPDNSADILKALTDFFNSKASIYYDRLNEAEIQKAFAFITDNTTKEQIIDAHKKFNQK